jgi:predicted nucleic acid-binding protein
VCLIVDADAANEFLAKSGAVASWLLGKKGNPRLVVAGTLKEELVRLGAVRRLLRELERAGRLRSAGADNLRREQDRLRADERCKSNDHHVLALAIVSGAHTLATFDNALADDFRNADIINRPRGSIYRDPTTHAHLLRHTPRSCGVRSTDNPRGPRGR